MELNTLKRQKKHSDIQILICQIKIFIDAFNLIKNNAEMIDITQKNNF